MSEESKVEVLEEKTKNEVSVNFKEDGLVLFKNHNELTTAAKFLLHIKLAPDHLAKEGLNAVTTALLFCQQHRLPYSAMNEIGVVKGKAGAFGSLVTALAKRDHDFGEMIVLYVNEKMEEISLANKNLKDEVYACVIRIKKKSSEIWKEFFFTVDEARKAGLLNNNTYQKYLKDMLFHRAKFRALKTEHADYLSGVESYEILNDEVRMREVSPVEEWNKRLGLLEE